MSEIIAEVTKLVQIDIILNYGVTITAPYYFPPRIYQIAYIEVIGLGNVKLEVALEKLLGDKIWTDYPLLIGDLPLMTLIDLPYEVTHPTNIKLIYPRDIVFK
jgi:hypothetical protein